MRIGLTSSLAATALATAGAALADRADPIEMPSGLVSYLFETIADETNAFYRFRFVSTEFSRGSGLEVIATDLDHLCETFALPEVPEGAQIIVSLADAPSEFGVAAPDIAQVFEAYRAENGRCIWEGL